MGGLLLCWVWSTFLFDNLWEKRLVPPTEQSGIASFKILVAHKLKIAAISFVDPSKINGLF